MSENDQVKFSVSKKWLINIGALIVIYFAASWYCSKNVSGTIEELLTKEANSPVKVESVYFSEMFLLSNIRHGKAMISWNGKNSSIEFTATGNGVWGDIYVEMTGVALIQSGIRNVFDDKSGE